MGKYKIGDKVRVICDNNSIEGKRDLIGKIFTVANIVTDRSRGYEYRLCDSSGYTGYIWRNSELELVVDKSAKSEKIVITHDGKTTTATHYRPDGTKKVATAKCHLEDTFDFNVGAKLAMERLTTPEPPKYYNGKVVCVNNCGNSHNYTIGKIYQFVDGVLTTDCGTKYRTHDPVTSFEDWTHWTASKFIEIVE